MQAKGQQMLDARNYKLAKDMLERCLTYYDSIGPHWLVSPRKARTRSLLGVTMYYKDRDSQAVEPVLQEAKKTAQKELGPSHRATLACIWQVRATSARPCTWDDRRLVCGTCRHILGTIHARHDRCIPCMLCLRLRTPSAYMRTRAALACLPADMAACIICNDIVSWRALCCAAHAECVAHAHALCTYHALSACMLVLRAWCVLCSPAFACSFSLRVHAVLRCFWSCKHQEY